MLLTKNCIQNRNLDFDILGIKKVGTEDVFPNLFKLIQTFPNGPIDWDKFKFNLDQNINLKVALKTHSDIDNAAEGIIRTIQQSAIKATSPTNPQILNSSKSLPADIKQLIINKRHARAKWQTITDKDKANIFASQLAEIFKPHSCSVPENDSIVEIQQFLSAPLPMSLPAKPIYPGEIQHLTIHQVHRLIDEISTALENKEYCSGLFLDIAQAFDRVWYKGLPYKLKLFMPAPYYLIIKSYLQNRSFVVRQGNDISSTHSIYAGVPQGSDLFPDLYNIFTADIPQFSNTLLATYADDTAILSSSSNPNLASAVLQDHANKIDEWVKNGKLK
ncbi:hypothetical protein QTP88_006080 [Uroleucon formosanum]